ncbi:MAG TPA: AgmX/PglI C-terminal domain-containing protein [Pseudomonadota bacterium]|nr:AgmX/PglI C-terminal domain-containing protein [Pseudomonadota bacterium]
MRGFLFGFLVCALLCAGAYHQYLRPQPLDPCRVCSTGTRCVADLCIAQTVPPQPVAKKRGYRPRGPVAVGTPSPSGSSPASPAADPGQPEAPPPPTVILRPEDKRQQSAGDKLNTTEVINMEDSHLSDRELQQEDFDAVFRPRQGDILGCIDDARGDAQLEGQVAVAFRVQRTGKVSGVRVEAPAYLLDHGFLACVRKVVQSLSFPVSNKSQVVTYPFALR